MRYFIDTEFDARGHDNAFNLISIGIVAEDGREFYAVSDEFDPDECDDWVKRNVLGHLPSNTEWKSLPEIMEGIIKFIDNDSSPEFIGYFADFDWTFFCQIFHKMVHMPPNFPGWCFDIRQWVNILEVSGQVDPLLLKQAKPPKPQNAHDALADAHWTRQYWENVAKLAGYRAP